MNPARTLVIGLGNEFRRDDGVGLLVVRALRAGPLGLRTDVELSEQHGDGTTLMQSWAGRERVIVVDAAMQPDAAPGTILEMMAGESSLPPDIRPRASSHAFSLPEAVRLAREMNRLPKELRIYCVIGTDFGNGTVLSPALPAAISEVAARITTGIDA